MSVKEAAERYGLSPDSGRARDAGRGDSPDEAAIGSGDADMTSDFSTGPYLQMAFFCEKVLEEKDGVSSAIRIVDRITHTATGPEPPGQMPPVPIALTAMISFKSGSARGRHILRVIPETPSGLRLAEISLPVQLEGDDRGMQATMNIRLQAEQEGLYWFDVFFDDVLVTRMPLRVVYQPMRLGTSRLPQ
jgi:hypothetical protein